MTFRSRLWLVTLLAAMPLPVTAQTATGLSAGLIYGGTAHQAPAPLAVQAAPGEGAHPLQAAAARIESLLAAGQRAEAYAAGRAFLRQVTQATGFGVTNAHLTQGQADGFGMFMPRPDNVYLAGEPVEAYVEVYGFSLTPRPGNVNQLLFDVSFTLITPDGRQMTDAMIPMGEIQLDSRSAPLDGFFHLTYRVTGAVGAYALRTEVVDRASGERAEFTLPVVFVDPAGQPQAGK
ncbi:MAG: hypothetical protein H6899_07460 [Rhodobacter sp.]|nr:hypothetical protein [Rhodobacter sp.]